ncbi:MAG: hypothetical protein QG597_4554 [Actinomycetota bacterium]|nr:hypothetical protein [Actinomycetota bacterium]
MPNRQQVMSTLQVPDSTDSIDVDSVGGEPPSPLWRVPRELAQRVVPARPVRERMPWLTCIRTAPYDAK